MVSHPFLCDRGIVQHLRIEGQATVGDSPVTKAPLTSLAMEFEVRPVARVPVVRAPDLHAGRWVAGEHRNASTARRNRMGVVRRQAAGRTGGVEPGFPEAVVVR